MRVLRLAYVGSDAGMMTLHDKYLASMRSIVVPQIKRELHDAKTVLKPKLRADGKQEVDDKGKSLYDDEDYEWHSGNVPVESPRVLKLEEELPTIRLPKLEPAVIHKNYGDDHVKTVSLQDKTAMVAPVTECACGSTKVGPYGCKKCALAFRPLRHENKRFPAEGLKVSAQIRESVLKRYPTQDYDSSYVSLVAEDTPFANDKSGELPLREEPEASRHRRPHGTSSRFWD